MPACARSRASCGLEENAASSISASPRESLVISIDSTSGRSCRASLVISGISGPYAYLPDSVERFPEPQEMLARMRLAGFREASWTPYTFGIAGLYRGKK